MKFFSKEIQEALISGKTITIKNDKEHYYYLGNNGDILFKNTNGISFFSFMPIDKLTSQNWEVVEEPKYEYLWVVEPKAFGHRMITSSYYKNKEDVEKIYPESIILEKCEWSKRRI